jgi:hypothetical protein
MKNEHSDSRREFVKKAAYVVPAILTLQAAPGYANVSSLKSTKRLEQREKVQDWVQNLRDQLKDKKVAQRLRGKEGT